MAEQVAIETKPVATMACEVCGRQVIHSVTSKNKRAIVLEAGTFSERKALGRFVLTDKGAKAIGIHDQLCGDEGHPIHVHAQTLARALEHHEDLKDLHDATNESLKANYDPAAHEALKAAFHERAQELGVVFRGANTNFHSLQPEPPDPGAGMPELAPMEGAIFK